MRSTTALALVAIASFAPPARAHFNMLLPQAASAKKGEAITFTYQWGHPYEHQLFDAPEPMGVTVLTPRGQKISLTKELEKVSLAAGEGKSVGTFRFRFTPTERGDHVFVLQTPRIWMEEDREFLQDRVKVVLHVQAQKGWDNLVRPDFEFLPLTRPYGLQADMVFQAQIAGGVPKPNSGIGSLANVLVEIERYNPVAPRELPPDEQITRTARTDPNGVVTATLTDPGWWCLTAGREVGTQEREGKAYPVRQRSTLWVFVGEKAAQPR
jgi:uncharacterized GH25 family protein